jgi:hypothetical protein
MSSLSVVLHWFHCGIRSLPSLLAPHDPSSLFMWLENTSAVAIFVARCLLFMGVDAQSSSLLCACLPIFGLHSGVSPPAFFSMCIEHGQAIPSGLETQGTYKVLLMRSRPGGPAVQQTAALCCLLGNHLTKHYRQTKP